jgi:hypothetical protein
MVFAKCKCPENTEHDKSYNCQCNDKNQEPSSSDTQVVNALPVMQMALQFHLFIGTNLSSKTFTTGWLPYSYILLRVPYGTISVIPSYRMYSCHQKLSYSQFPFICAIHGVSLSSIHYGHSHLLYINQTHQYIA